MTLEEPAEYSVFRLELEPVTLVVEACLLLAVVPGPKTVFLHQSVYLEVSMFAEEV